MSESRCAEVKRTTSETDIRLTLALDGSGKAEIDTGIGFLDHMLESFARHGLFDLKVSVKGDLAVDCHHTVEDTGIVLGNAIKTVREDAVFNMGRSGMAKRTPEEIGFHAIRRGNIPGIHEVIVSTDNQCITLKHEVYDRALFADGALSAARFLAGKAPGMYEMADIIK